jgi:hypothetical protein
MPSIAQGRIGVHLMANQETIDRLVEQGVLLSKAFHAEHERNPTGHEAEFLRGNFTGWRSTVHALYHNRAEQIVDRVLTQTNRPLLAREMARADDGVSCE